MTRVLVVVLPCPVTLNVTPFIPLPLSTSITLSVSDALPLLKETAPKVEFVNISGVEELSYACCNVVVDRPPEPPTTSPNLEANLNLALVVSERLLADLFTDRIPISMAPSLLFEYSIYISSSAAVLASAKVAYTV